MVFLLVNASPLLPCSRRYSVRSAAYTSPNVLSSLFSMPPGRERVAGRSRGYRNGGCDRRRDGSQENQSRNPGDCELVRWDLDRFLASRFSSALGTIRVSHCYSAMSPRGYPPAFGRLLRWNDCRCVPFQSFSTIPTRRPNVGSGDHTIARTPWS